MKSRKGVLGFSVAVMISVAGCSTSPFGSDSSVSNISGSVSALSGQTTSPYERGKVYLHNGQFGLAIKAFQSAMARGDESVKTLNGLAVAYDRIGRGDVAESYYKVALAQRPGSVQTLNNLGYSNFLRGQFETAQKWFDQAVQLARETESEDDAEIVHSNIQLVHYALKEGESSDGSGSTDVAENRDTRSVSDSDETQTVPSMWVQRNSRTVQSLVTSVSARLRQRLLGADVTSMLIAPPLNEGGRSADSERPPYIQRVSGLPTVITRPEGVTRPPQGSVEVARLTEGAGVSGYGLRAATPPSSALVVEVSNGAGRRHMAARMRQYLASYDLPVRRLTNARTFTNEQTVIFYRGGHRIAAERVSTYLPKGVELRRDDNQAADVRIRLGGDLLEFDAKLIRRFKTS